MYIAVDFDGTVVTHEFPYVGEDVGAVPILRQLANSGHHLILYTMRSHKPHITDDGEEIDTLQEAIDWFKQNDIELYAVNSNPTQESWTDSPKVHANMYIDDAAFGCPKCMKNGNVVVDWNTIGEFFKKVGLINTIL